MVITTTTPWSIVTLHIHSTSSCIPYIHPIDSPLFPGTSPQAQLLYILILHFFTIQNTPVTVLGIMYLTGLGIGDGIQEH